jgi:hypothetical protein
LINIDFLRFMFLRTPAIFFMNSQAFTIYLFHLNFPVHTHNFQYLHSHPHFSSPRLPYSHYSDSNTHSLIDFHSSFHSWYFDYRNSRSMHFVDLNFVFLFVFYIYYIFFWMKSLNYYNLNISNHLILIVYVFYLFWNLKVIRIILRV